MQKFRIDGKAFFLTYPQCPLDRDVVLEELRKRLVGHVIDSYCIAREQHEDGADHIHALIVLDKRKNVHSPSYFDIGSHHGNYQTARNRVKVFDYLTKSDPTPLTNMSAESLKIKNSNRAQIGKRILEGEDLKDIVEEYPNLLFGYKRLKEDLVAFKNDQKVYVDLPFFLPNPWGFLMSGDQSVKKRHWWIYSDMPNRGKTTFARHLAKEYGAYVKSADFSYWNVTGKESLIVLDDYNTAGMRFNALNQLCDGFMEARVFMGGNVRIEPTLVIVLSNVKIVDLYPFKSELIHARFHEKCIN